MTVSCGVAGSRTGEHFDFDALYAEADAALYDAKRDGRNQVRPPRPVAAVAA